MIGFSSAVIAALIASVSLGSAARAEGDYYEGLSKASSAASSSLDHLKTGSIAPARNDDRRGSDAVFSKTTRDNR